MRYTLSNSEISIQVDSHGAELKSLIKDGHEYLWQADSAFWERSAPVLFPLVGSLKNKTFVSHDRTYHMNQHGFARDMEFELASQSADTLTMRLKSTPETIEAWPYEFALEITYFIHGSSVDVSWAVHNPGSEDMYFSIGAHPAFYCPQKGHSFVAYVNAAGGASSDVAAGGQDALVPASDEIINWVSPEGLLTRNTKNVRFDNGRLPITRELYRYGNGTLVFADTRIKRISLADDDLREYVTVNFDMPLVALWSPDKEGTPFVCIEPWYGVCDFEDADGIWEHRAYGNRVAAGDTFKNTYTISIN